MHDESAAFSGRYRIAIGGGGSHDAGKSRAVVEKLANSAMKAGPWSVTFKRPTGVKVDAGPNDYYSEGPYWWPDPKNPGGPYIRKDGEQNPNCFTGNRNDLGNMCETVLALGMGAFLLNKAACAEHAATILSVWFLDGKTRMNPNLEYGRRFALHGPGNRHYRHSFADSCRPPGSIPARASASRKSSTI